MPAFPNKARVAFIGDSLTAVFNYQSLIANYYIENLPDSHVRIYNCGVAGGTAWSQLEYLSDDILCHSPTHAVIALGVNDSGRWAFEWERNEDRYRYLTECYEAYKKNLCALCDELEKNNIIITLCTPVPYAEYQKTDTPAYRGGYALMAGYADFCRKLAKERSYELCDYHSYMTEKMQTEDLHVTDHVHLTDKGHYYLAKCFLAHQGLELGEQKAIPESFNALIDASTVVRDIFATELMIIRNYSLPLEEKLKIVQEYIDNGSAPDDYFKRISERFAECKSRQQEYVKLTQKLTDELMG